MTWEEVFASDHKAGAEYMGNITKISIWLSTLSIEPPQDFTQEIAMRARYAAHFGNIVLSEEQ